MIGRSVRQLLCALFVGGALAISSLGAEINLTWNANPESDIAGYKVYATDLTTGIRGTYNVGPQTECSFAPETGHSYAFTVTAYNLAGLESEPSSEVRYEAPADSLTVSWEPTVYPSGAQYRLSYGQMNQTAQQYTVGPQTSAVLAGLQRGVSYYFYVEGFDAYLKPIDAWQQVTYLIPTAGPLGEVHLLRANLVPQVSLTSPGANASYTEPANIPLSANASDLDGAIRLVEFYAGSTRIASVSAPPYSFAWNGVPAGSYQISATAIDSSGASTRSSIITVTVKAPVPAAPYNLGAVASENSTRLTWLHSGANETGFRVYRSSGGSFSLIATLAANSVDYADSGLPSGTGFLYRVTAFNSSGESAPAEVGTTTKVPAPGVPVNVVATPVTSVIVVSWAASEGANQYSIERSLNSAGPFNAIGTAAITQWTDATAAPGTTYYYRVLAGANGLMSAPSAVVSAALQGAPEAPTSISASVAGKGQIKVSWRDVSASESSYHVERSVDGTTFSRIATLPANSTGYIDATVSPRRKYYYRVAAVNAYGASLSSVASVKSR